MEVVSSIFAYLISVVSAVRAKFWCKKIPEKREIYCFGLCLYRSSECIILDHYQCVILHLMFDFTLAEA